ncbi:hypothetical protein LJC48_04150 [Desulfovibrio sp. OttesenSCG-928-C06]|nr:hypothetical protein [Desulfovibrio sp. OttesenSCG-928-C06]
MKTNKTAGQDEFAKLKHLLSGWCMKEEWGFRIETGEREESFWLTAGRNDNSEELNARTGLNVFFSPPSVKMRDRAVGRLYAPELPGASVYIIRTAGKWRFIHTAPAGNGRETDFEGRPADISNEEKAGPKKTDYPFSEAAFKKLINSWLKEFMSGKNFSYKH